MAKRKEEAVVKEHVILAFMQNMWVKPEKIEEVRKSLERWKDNPEYWNRICKGLMFNGKNRSGINLKAAFGDMVWEIIWDETTKEICDNPKTVPKPDRVHIMDTLKRIQPDIIITFGEVAHKAVNEAIMVYNYYSPDNVSLSPKMIKCYHPAAQHPDTKKKLEAAAQELRSYIAWTA